MISRMLLVILFTATLVFAPAPRAEAIDPVTIAILAPVALKVAQRASPYIIRSLQAGGMGVFRNPFASDDAHQDGKDGGDAHDGGETS